MERNGSLRTSLDGTGLMLVGRVCEIRNEPVADLASASPPSFQRPTGAALTITSASVLPCGCSA
eukprot:6554185-Prymnesium_polylepis.1